MESGHGDQVQVVHRELGQLRNAGLRGDGRHRGIDPDGEIVQGDFEHVLADLLRPCGMVRQRLEVRNQHVCRVLVQEFHAIL